MLRWEGEARHIRLPSENKQVYPAASVQFLRSNFNNEEKRRTQSFIEVYLLSSSIIAFPIPSPTFI